jgi:hypothetical protein
MEKITLSNDPVASILPLAVNLTVLIGAEWLDNVNNLLMVTLMSVKGRFH